MYAYVLCVYICVDEDVCKRAGVLWCMHMYCVCICLDEDVCKCVDVLWYMHVYCVYICVDENVCKCVDILWCKHTCVCVYMCWWSCMGWLWLVGFSKIWVSFAKEPYKRHHILQKIPLFGRSLLIIATPYVNMWMYCDVRTCMDVLCCM